MDILSPAMKEAIAALGELIKADPRNAAIKEAIDAYEHSEELNSLIAEYNTQQNVLSDLYGKTHGSDSDESAVEMRDAIQDRIDALYDQITGHPIYTAYVAAKEAFDALTNEVYGELQFVITGQRPCNHDCSSCGGGCSCGG